MPCERYISLPEDGLMRKSVFNIAREILFTGDFSIVVVKNDEVLLTKKEAGLNHSLKLLKN